MIYDEEAAVEDRFYRLVYSQAPLESYLQLASQEAADDGLKARCYAHIFIHTDALPERAQMLRQLLALKAVPVSIKDALLESIVEACAQMPLGDELRVAFVEECMTLIMETIWVKAAKVLIPRLAASNRPQDALALCHEILQLRQHDIDTIRLLLEILSTQRDYQHILDVVVGELGDSKEGQLEHAIAAWHLRSLGTAESIFRRLGMTKTAELCQKQWYSEPQPAIDDAVAFDECRKQSIHDTIRDYVQRRQKMLHLARYLQDTKKDSIPLDKLGVNEPTVAMAIVECRLPFVIDQRQRVLLRCPQ